MRYVLLALTLFAISAFAQEVSIGANDTTQSMIMAQKGKRITVRLRSGYEITGIVRDTNGKVVVLGNIVSRELFDAVVPLETVEAVLIRTKQ